MQILDLVNLYSTDPAKARDILISTPELVDELLDLGDKIEKLDNVTLEGFKMAYLAFYDRELPEIDEAVAREFVKAFHAKKGVMYMSWRGKGKTTFLIAWCAYLIGVRPVGSTVMVRINDNKAKETGKAIATLIETNPGWKKLFSHVVPDKQAGWSNEAGFNVMDTRITGSPDDPNFQQHYEEWRALCLKDHNAEQTLICAGIESGSLIGVHPSNGMWFDDLHDESNTRSQAEMKKVVDILEGNIIPTWFSAGGSPTLGVFCTPWNDQDAYQAMLRTGLFKLFKLPIYTLDDNGELFGPLQIRIKPTWPEKFPIELIEQLWQSNPARFSQMYLCDLESLKGLRLKTEWLHPYPAREINPGWPVYFGIDFASTSDKLRNKDSDYFCCAIGRMIPGGGMVLVGGFRDRLSISDALVKIQTLANFYPTLVSIGVERFGTGKDFAELLKPLVFSLHLPVLTFPFEGAPVRSKGQKFELELAPMFTDGRLWVSDEEDDFITHFKEEWRSWDGIKSLTKHDDTLDATYGMAYVAQGNLAPRPKAGELPVGNKKKQLSPLARLGSDRGYGR